MTDLTQLLDPTRIACQHDASSKKKTLESAAALLATATHGIEEGAIFEALIKRERLGSTGLGHGIALPHGRIEGLQQPVAALLTLSRNIGFDALDGEPVDIVFALAMPENCDNQHLQILASLAEIFSNTAVSTRLRSAVEAQEIWTTFCNWRDYAESA